MVIKLVPERRDAMAAIIHAVCVPVAGNSAEAPKTAPDAPATAPLFELLLPVLAEEVLPEGSGVGEGMGLEDADGTGVGEEEDRGAETGVGVGLD